GFRAAQRRQHLGDAQEVVEIPVFEVPARFFIGGQDEVGDPLIAVGQRHDVTGAQLGDVRVQVQRDGRIGAHDAQHGAAAVLDFGEGAHPLEDFVEQLDLVALTQVFHQAGLVHHPVERAGAALFFIEVKAFDLLFADRRLHAAAGDLEGFAGAQGKHLGGRVVLRQRQAPAAAEPAVAVFAGKLGGQRIEAQAQRQRGAAQGVAFEFRQADGTGVLTGARVDTGFDETEKVEGVGVN
nr:hypothetical protein [Tanacetum cinerariifolium]